jgi:DNA topoisomerase-1
MTATITYTDVSARITALYGDAQQCAAAAGLAYVSDEEPGIRRRRSGRGFGYRDADGRALNDQAVKERILALAIPPAWRNVWICPDADGHILAVGEDDRGRKQYIYHERWRELRDLLNFYRLISFAEHLSAVRDHVTGQLRRRTLDRDRVLAAMIRIVDTTAIRIGSEVYAEENESYGLSTLTRRHVRVHDDTIEMSFPAKSGKHADLRVRDRQVARVVAELARQRRARLFTVEGASIDAGDVNEVLVRLTGEHITAKDFRTWRGTLAAFSFLEAALREQPELGSAERVDLAGKREATVLGAVDAAAEVLGNTRSVARAHYVHPHVLSSFVEGTFAGRLSTSASRRQQLLDGSERHLLAFLKVALEADFDAAAAGLAPAG